VTTYNPDGIPAGKFNVTAANSPEFLAVDSNGKVYVTIYFINNDGPGRVYTFLPNGTRTTPTITALWPWGIAVDPKERSTSQPAPGLWLLLQTANRRRRTSAITINSETDWHSSSRRLRDNLQAGRHANFPDNHEGCTRPGRRRRALVRRQRFGDELPGPSTARVAHRVLGSRRESTDVEAIAQIGPTVLSAFIPVSTTSRHVKNGSIISRPNRSSYLRSGCRSVVFSATFNSLGGCWKAANA